MVILLYYNLREIFLNMLYQLRKKVDHVASHKLLIFNAKLEFGVWQLFIGGLCVKYGTPYALDFVSLSKLCV